ncbi:J domain-containing protein [Ktedonosporobacter rubrisoli]|nr:J domain-containing protein [Ktedonosporobacter rubrisoli]
MEPQNDYYRILGIEPEASEIDIKRAYRRLAKRYHPDINKSPTASKHFMAVQAAYEVLSNPAQRQTFDQQRTQKQATTTTINPWAFTPTRPSAKQAARSSSMPEDKGYIIHNLQDGQPVRFLLDTLFYVLSADDVRRLKRGMLRGLARNVIITKWPAGVQQTQFSCRSCHHSWTVENETAQEDVACPKCSTGYREHYLLLYCRHCHAIFEDKAMRKKWHADPGQPLPSSIYDELPRCPHCYAPDWCELEGHAQSTSQARHSAGPWSALQYFLADHQLLVAILILAILLIGIIVIVSTLANRPLVISNPSTRSIKLPHPTVYISFVVQPNGNRGYIEAIFYENGHIVDTQMLDSQNFPAWGSTQQFTSAAYTSSATAGSAELYWCPVYDCAHRELKDVIDFQFFNYLSRTNFHSVLFLATLSNFYRQISCISLTAIQYLPL